MIPTLSSKEKILSDLNPAQNEAVMHGSGPQLIIAGAGTGKTAVITRRIAHLVTSKICSSKEILALTFTDKAAEEMESRVDVLVPYGFTDSTICTFHAFGDHLLREHGIALGINPNYKVLSTSEQLILLREYLFELPLKRLLPLSDPTRHLQLILNIISRAKDEDVSPEDYLRYCEELETRNHEQADPADIAWWEKQHELANIYSAYQKLLVEKGLADFGDLIVQALKLLRSNPDVLADIRQRYRYILVDEFQDTNAAQFEMLRLIAGEHGNITVVGDDDQSIYKFRGAAISNILQFTRYYPTTKIIILNENYRSTQTILDTAYRLIQHNNPDRLEIKKSINKRLQSHKGLGVPVVYHNFDTVSAEADWVAKNLKERRKISGKSWSDFAVLIRANKHADPFIRAFNLLGIPYRFSGYQGLYQKQEVRLCISFLRALADPMAPLPLHELAASDVYGLPAEDLAYIAAESRKRNKTMKSVLEQVVSDANPIITEKGKEIGKRLLADLAAYQAMTLKISTGQILYRFLTECGLLARYTEAGTVAADLMIKNIAEFFGVVQRFENVSRSNRVVHFVQHLDMLEDVGDDPSSSEMDPDIEAVNVLTVHRAKGLEFDIVYIVSLSANRFPSINRNSALALPLELAKEELPTGDPFISEERRLFYVALTRAKDELVFTSSKDYGGTRAHKLSRFVLEALELPKENMTVIQTSSLEKIEAYAPKNEVLISPPGPIPKNDTLSLSYYQIDDYLTCPLKYKYIHILNIPVLPHHAILYGKALHTAITAYYRQKMIGISMPETELIQVFIDSWVNEGFISREHEEIRQKAGIESLKLFINNDNVKCVIPKYIEKAFTFTLGTNKIVGRMDRIDVTPNGKMVIVDFKSSEVFEQKEADKKAKESLQLKIYACAWFHLEKVLPERLELYFIDSGIIGSTAPDLEVISKTESIIAEVAENVRQRQYTANPNIWVCNYCSYRTICPQAAL